ncbi:MAG: endonuclease/exonuclease/phosphatase family protein [Gammaproteobacteria bacterium]|nr:endonuclease/exonuclease/phosphatase family protein [Gammaproteobacteria bacterium]
MQPFQLRVLTYNIHKGFSPNNRRFVLPQIRHALERTHADVIFLQEIQGEHQHRSLNIPNWPESSQFEFLADRLWPHHTYGKNAIYRNGHHGNAILSKFPFSEWENINVARQRWASRSVLHGVVRPDRLGSPIHLICIHLGLREAEREHQITVLCERIDSHVPHHEPLIVAGDFNDWRGRSERHLKDDLGLQEAHKTLHGHHARTFPARWPLLAVDRIYTRGFSVQVCNRLDAPNWRKLSDHIPLLAELTERGQSSLR